MISLQKICKDIFPSLSEELGTIRVTGIASDSRVVKPGYLFIAVQGYNTDGHLYIKDALRRGAVAVIAEKDVSDCAVPVLHVDDSRRAAAAVAHRFYGEVSGELLLIGITGTNGKTTVSLLMESILKSGGYETGVIGTIKYRWAGKERIADRTTPDSIILNKMLREMRDDGVNSVVMEVSSHALVLERVAYLTFKGGLFTNLSRDHLDFHDSFTQYCKSKALLFRQIDSDGVCVINGDDPSSHCMIENASARVITYGIDSKDLDYKIERISGDYRQNTFRLISKDRNVLIKTDLPGAFNVVNCGSAAVMGLELGIDEEAVKAGIEDVHSVPGRMERIDSGRGFNIIVDYAHTPSAVENLLRSVREFTENRLIVVFGCGGDRDRGKRSEMGRIASSLADIVIVTSDNPRGEDPESIIDDIMGGVGNKKGVERIVDRRDAIIRGVELSGQGDVLVIAGKGHETYQQIGNEKIPFDDRLVVRQILEREWE